MGAIETANGAAAQGKRNAFTKVSADYTATLNDRFLAVDCSNGSVSIALPSAYIQSAGTYPIFSPCYEIKKIDNTRNHVNILPSNSETVDGGGGFTLDDSQESISLISDGSNWLVY